MTRHFIETTASGDCEARHELGNFVAIAPTPIDPVSVMHEIDPPAWGSGWPAAGSVHLPTATSVLTFIGGAFGSREAASLADLRQAKVNQINAAHMLANVTSFTFMGKEIQANAHSMQQIQITDLGIRRRGGLRANWQGAWKTLDNGHVLIPDLATWNAFMDAIEDTGSANFAKAQALKAQLASATTSEQVAAITWSTT